MLRESVHLGFSREQQTIDTWMDRWMDGWMTSREKEKQWKEKANQEYRERFWGVGS